MQTAGAPKLQTAKTSSLALLARLEPSLRFRFSLSRSGVATKKQAGRDAPHIGRDRQYGRVTSSGPGISNMGAMLRMSPKHSNSPRDFVRARHQQ